MNAPEPFHVVAKPIGPRCNINCSYCYYLDKERLYPDQKKFRMRDDVLEVYVRDFIAAQVAAGQTSVQFVWQGGEPTVLGLEFFERAVSLQRRYCPRGIEINNALQTNGSLLDREWAAFFARESFLIGVSVDGPRQVHDQYRRDRAGRPTFAAVMRGITALQQAGVAYNILTTVHRGNGIRGKEVYRFLKTLGTSHIQFIPIVERQVPSGTLAAAPQIDGNPAHAVSEWSISPKVYGRFLCDVFDAWYRHDIGKVFIQIFETQIGLWMGQPSSLCVFARTCGNAFALEHNGDLYACDHFVYPEYRLGNITDQAIGALARSNAADRFGRDKCETLTPQCRSCQFLFACNGGCLKHRILNARGDEPGHNYFCESYTMFFRHAGERLRFLATMVGGALPLSTPAAVQARPGAQRARRSGDAQTSGDRSAARKHRAASPGAGVDGGGPVPERPTARPS